MNPVDKVTYLTTSRIRDLIQEGIAEYNLNKLKEARYT